MGKASSLDTSQEWSLPTMGSGWEGSAGHLPSNQLELQAGSEQPVLPVESQILKHLGFFSRSLPFKKKLSFPFFSSTTLNRIL